MQNGEEWKKIAPFEFSDFISTNWCIYGSCLLQAGEPSSLINASETALWNGNDEFENCGHHLYNQAAYPLFPCSFPFQPFSSLPSKLEEVGNQALHVDIYGWLWKRQE